MLVDYQMQFEAIEPAHRRSAPGGQPSKDLVTLDAAVMANFDRC